MIALRRDQPVLRRRRFFQGRRIRGSEVKDLAWFRPDGKEMTDEDWNQGYVRSLGLRLAGDALEEVDDKGRRVVGETLLILLNAHHEPLTFTLPAHKRGVRWEHLLSTEGPRETETGHDLEGRRFLRAGGEVHGGSSVTEPGSKINLATSGCYCVYSDSKTLVVGPRSD